MVTIGRMMPSALDGANPVRVWREHRGISRKPPAEAAGVSTAYLSQIESEKTTASPETLAAIAQELGLSLDDIIDECSKTTTLRPSQEGTSAPYESRFSCHLGNGQ